MRRSALGVLLLCALSGTAFAQDKMSFVTPTAGDVMSSNLVGTNVYNLGGEDIGEIEDLIMSDGSSVRGVVLSVGGFLGVGTHYVAVDPKALDIKHDDAKNDWRVTLDATKDQLKAAPQYEYTAKQKN